MSTNIYIASIEFEIPIAADTEEEAKDILRKNASEMISDVSFHDFDIRETDSLYANWEHGNDEIWGDYVTDDGEELYLMKDIYEYIKNKKDVEIHINKVQMALDI